MAIIDPARGYGEHASCQLKGSVLLRNPPEIPERNWANLADE